MREIINKSMVSPDLHAFQCVVYVSKAGTQQLFPQTGPVVWLGHSAAVSRSSRRYKKFYSRKLWVNTADLQVHLSFCFCPFSLLFHRGQDLIELQRNETETFPSEARDQNP